MRGRTNFLLVLVLSLGFVTDGFPADDQATYRYQVFDFPGADQTLAYGMNDAGLVVGAIVKNGQHGFLKDGDKFTIIEPPDARASIAYGINNAGQIVGFFDSGTGYLGFTYDSEDNHYESFDISGASYIEAHGINARGQISGYFNDSRGWVHGFLKDRSGVTIIDVPNASFTYVYGINERGHVVGIAPSPKPGLINEGFIWDGKKFTFFNAPGSTSTNFYGINASGDIVGIVESSSGPSSFLKRKDQYIPIHVPSAMGTEARGINNAHEIVGDWGDGRTFHGFVASPMRD